jgi:hypothetical protein
MKMNLSEKENQACIKLFEKSCCIDHSGASFFSHLYNTFYILKRIGSSETTALAGLYHAVYGTEIFNHDSLFSEEEVRLLIGNESEELVRYFSLKDRFSVIFENSLGLDTKKLLALTEILYANDLEQSRGGPPDEKYFSSLTQQIEQYRSIVDQEGA